MPENYLNEFKNPSSKHRGAPFWSWNCKLDKDMLLRQIDYFNEMGMGGFTIHSRVGLDTPYLGDEFMDIVKACVEKAKKLNMKVCLYDEDRWPSGSCGGEVTKDISMRERRIIFTPFERTDSELIARYSITLSSDGYLTEYKQLMDNETGDNIWYAYLNISSNNPWFNNQAYVNTLDKKAIEKFIKSTHEKYKAAVGKDFGEVIPSIFTDEPQFSHKCMFGKADEKRELSIPYTDDFEETFQTTYKQSFLNHLPEIFWDLPDKKISTIRYYYHDHLTERFASAFSDTLGDWCQANNIKLTGHMLFEETLHTQSRAIGEAMRCYRGFQIPGIDILCDNREYSTAKQAQSAAHQLGANEITSELYGVTNWNFDFRGHKLQGDWQAALGITHRVHHLSWVSMAGEAKRDYPASIFYQSPWYKEYNTIETYFSRINTALKTGSPNINIGVIHPIESYWLHVGPEEHTQEIRAQLQTQFDQVTNWLLFGLLDFNYISEALMNDLSDRELPDKTDCFKVGKMCYDAIVVPGCKTLRKTTYDRLLSFVKNGGKVVFMGDFPKYIDALPIQEDSLFTLSEHIPFDSELLMDKLQDLRLVDIKDNNSVRSKRYIYQMRNDGENKIIFIANGRKDYNPDVPHHDSLTLTFRGNYHIEILDAMTGDKHLCDTFEENGNTILKYGMFEQDSLLIYLSKKAPQNISKQLNPPYHPSLIKTLKDVKDYKMSEKNVLLLDQPEFSLDGEAFRASDEILRIDNILRSQLGYPLKMEALAQPWTDPSNKPAEHTLTLKYSFTSEIALDNCFYALENPEICTIKLNSQDIDTTLLGYFVDESVKTIKLPSINKGLNELIITLPYSRKTNLEWSYILGDFGVQVYGNKSKITEKPDKIGCSDLTTQLLPFYAGNFTYVYEEFLESDGEYEIEITKYRSPLLNVRVDGIDSGNIMFSPYKLKLGHMNKGKHTIEVTAFGNRVNTFGAIHNSDDSVGWFGPNQWRTDGCQYSYEYQLRKVGLLAAPKLYKL